MLLLYVGLVAIGVGTLEGTVVGMGSQVSGETGRTVVDLVASRIGALDGL